MKRKILISTGGSGGHVIPAITIYDHLKFSYETLISTDFRGFRYLNKENYNYVIVNTPKLNNLFLLPISLFKVFFLNHFKSDEFLGHGILPSLLIPPLSSTAIIALNIN